MLLQSFWREKNIFHLSCHVIHLIREEVVLVVNKISIVFDERVQFAIQKKNKDECGLTCILVRFKTLFNG